MQNLVDKKYNKIEKYTSYTINIKDNNLELKYNNNIISTTFEIMGIYDITTKLFSWSNKFSLINKNKIKLTKQIKKYKKKLYLYLINNKYKDVEYVEKLYYYLSNNIFILNEENIIDIVKLAIYITNTNVVYNNNNNIITFYFIDKLFHN
jgi:hypothetical protein